jgi:MoxR-like ATPase
MTVMSCRTCPSFVPAEEAATVYVKSPNADSCAKFGRMLSRPDKGDDVNARICERFAASCADHGNPRPVPIPMLRAKVAEGDPAGRTRIGFSSADKPASCAQCEHFVQADIVKRELGWTLGMCAQIGRLIFPNRMPQEAAECGVGFKGPNRSTADGVILLPEYERSTPIRVGAGGVPAAQYVLTDEIARHQQDPRSYETDKEVTDEDRARNIRAWRKVNDPEGQKPPAYLPIFDGPALYGTDPRQTYEGMRPDLYVDHQGLLYDLACIAYKARRVPLLIGGAGTGKTELAFFFAYCMDLEGHRLQVSKGTEDYHWTGEGGLEVDPASGQNVTVWKDGRLSRLVGRPGVITMDELNVKSEIEELVRPLLDGSKALTLDAAQGVKRVLGDRTYLFATQNPSDDPIYVGTEPLSAAALSRVSPIQVGLPDDAVERAIIRKHCADDGYSIDTVTLDKIMQIAQDLRTMIADGALPIAWGIRDQVKVAVYTEFFGLEKAYRRAIIDGLERTTVDTVLATVRSVAS